MEPVAKHFKTNVLLKSIIGKDLINDDNIAILELVKNSYDANSARVNISFKNLKSNDDLYNQSYSRDSSKIVIQDFGVGMSEDDIEHKWLNIAYSDKKAKKVEFNRILAGAKGVGRFSCDRLGKYLDLYTRKAGGDIVHLSIDWEMFEIENQRDLEIQKIDVLQRTIPPANFKEESGFDLFEKGTVLEISKLRSVWAVFEKNKKTDDGWNYKRLLDLKKSLEKLVSPNQNFSENAFSIHLIVPEIKAEKGKPEYLRVGGEIQNKIFNKLEFTATSISSVISDEGETITTTITDKGRDIFILQERNVLFPLLKNVSIVTYFLNRYSKIYFARQTGIRSINFGSIYLFINGFRISPYGDEGDDWLGLERRKQQGVGRFLGTRELVGRIEIQDDENHFRIVSSREGLVKDDYLKELTNSETGFFYYTFNRLEKYVVEGLDWDRLTKKKAKGDGADEDEFNARVRAFVSEFEKKVNAKDWKFSPKDEVYFEDQLTKNKRILSIIDNIINVKPENIIELYINEELIIELVENERQRTEAKLKEVKENLSSFSINQIDQIILELEKEKGLLEASFRKIGEFSGEKIHPVTQRAFLNRSSELDSINLETENEKLRQEKEDAEKRAEAAEEDLRHQLSENLFYKSRLNIDVKELLLYHHDIGISAGAIENFLTVISNKLKKGKIISNADLEKFIKTISFEINKINTIVGFATKANFRNASQPMKGDLVEFVTEYIENVVKDMSKTVNNRPLNVELDMKENLVFEMTFIPMEIMMILDNLVKNSSKAGATKIRVTMAQPESEIEIDFSDNGIGIPHKNLPKVFDFGFTTTDGSGLGLYHVYEIVKRMRGEIEIKNRVGKGVEVLLKFPR